MRITRALIGSLAAIGVATGAAALPQTAWAANDGLPDGSWRQSCERAYVQNGTLYAQCRRDGGKYEFASAAIGSCRAFGNRNGTLFCESDDAGAGNSGNVGQWSGSFLNSCRDATVDKHGRLQATCRKENGTYKRSNLQAHKCPGYRAGNSNGNLVCESTGGASGSAGRWHGSFRDSCRDIAVDSSGTLRATCQASNGTWRRTSLSYRECGTYRAGNRNGTLYCESAGGSTNVANRWSGSFSQSCRDISMDSNGVLTATCQTMNGNWNRSSLSPRQCGGHRAGNRDGQLFCESAGGDGNVANRWSGSFSQSCRDISMDSNGVLTATCQTANGNWNRTSLSPRQCGSYRAGNGDGNLFCEQ